RQQCFAAIIRGTKVNDTRTCADCQEKWDVCRHIGPNVSNLLKAREEQHLRAEKAEARVAELEAKAKESDREWQHLCDSKGRRERRWILSKLLEEADELTKQGDHALSAGVRLAYALISRPGDEEE